MSKLTRAIRPYQGLLVPVVILALCAAALLFGVVPAVRGMMTLQQESSDLNEQNRAVTEKVTLLEALDETQLLNQLSILTSAVPTDNSPALLLASVEGLSAQAESTIVSVEIGSPGLLATESAKKQTSEEKQLGSNISPLTVTLEGTLAQIRSFLAAVGGVRQFMRVTNFTIAFNDEGIAKATIGMSGFFSPLPHSIGTASQALEPLTQDEEAVLGRVARIPVISFELPVTLVPAAGPFRPDPFSP